MRVRLICGFFWPWSDEISSVESVSLSRGRLWPAWEVVTVLLVDVARLCVLIVIDWLWLPADVDDEADVLAACSWSATCCGATIFCGAFSCCRGETKATACCCTATWLLDDDDESSTLSASCMFSDEFDATDCVGSDLSMFAPERQKAVSMWMWTMGNRNGQQDGQNLGLRLFLHGKCIHTNPWAKRQLQQLMLLN